MSASTACSLPAPIATEQDAMVDETLRALAPDALHEVRMHAVLAKIQQQLSSPALSEQ